MYHHSSGARSNDHHEGQSAPPHEAQRRCICTRSLWGYRILAAAALQQRSTSAASSTAEAPNQAVCSHWGVYGRRRCAWPTYTPIDAHHVTYNYKVLGFVLSGHTRNEVVPDHLVCFRSTQVCASGCCPLLPLTVHACMLVLLQLARGTGNYRTTANHCSSRA